MSEARSGLLSIASALIGAWFFGTALPSQAATQNAQERRDARDTRQDARQSGRQEKIDCRQADQKSNSQCRQ